VINNCVELIEWNLYFRMVLFVSFGCCRISNDIFVMYFDGSGDIFLLCDCTVSFHIAHELWIELCIESLYTVVNMKHSLNFIILIGIEKLKDILGLLHIGLIL